MNWINRFKALKIFLKIIIICLSVCIAFISVEFSYQILKESNNTNDLVKRSMLFQSGDNFQNYKDFFKYYPNTSIRSLTLYSKAKPTKTSDLIIEYDYDVSTNNAGLVMQNDLKDAEDVIYIIGDSFTEGVGASPWFYNMEESSDIVNVKLVNLAILGTGPAQWNSLKNHITHKFNLNVKGSVINIIPQDMLRKKWIMSKNELECLRTSACNYAGGFQGFDFEAGLDINHIKSLTLANLIYQENKIRSFKDFVKQSHVIVDIYSYIRHYIKSPSYIRNNENALLNLKQSSQNKIFVNLVSQKLINSRNYNSYPVVKNLVGFLEDNEFNFKWCDIPSDGFFKIDSHPNEKGYLALQRCTESAIMEIQKLNL